MDNDLLNIIQESDSRLYKGVSEIEQEFIKFVAQYVSEEFEMSGGKISNTTANKQKLIALRKKLIDAFQSKAAPDALRNYLADFDSVAELNVKLLENSISKSEFEKLTIENFSLEKQILSQSVIDTLSNKPTIVDSFTPAIRQTLFESIALNRTLKQTQAKLKEAISTEKKDSSLMRYVKQISKDSINQYSGSIQDKASQLYELDGFRYVGSLQDNSRSTCVNLVKGKGEFERLSLGGNKYKVEDIPKIISLSKDNDGWNPDTKPETFATLRGGYGCRHQVVYFKLLPSDLE